jgi:hypothetical protein
MKLSPSSVALWMAGQWCKMSEKSLTPLIFISIVAFGVFSVVVYFLLEPLLDSRTANLAVMICAITPGSIVAPIAIILVKQFAAGMSERIYDARIAREQSKREHDAKLRALEAAAQNRETQAQITASKAANIFDMQKTDDNSWEIPASWG